jgi:hypothetical protein
VYGLAVPVALKLTLVGPPSPSCAIESVALLVPVDVGLNFTEIVQLPVFAGIKLPQVFV